MREKEVSPLQIHDDDDDRYRMIRVHISSIHSFTLANIIASTKIARKAKENSC